MDLGLSKKVAIVTGGSEGIGRAVAESLAREGANVVICARRKEMLDNSVQVIKAKTGRTIAAVKADVSDVSGAKQVVDHTLKHFGRVDILVNNAGTSSAHAFESVDDEMWQADLDLKLFGAIRFARQVIPHMKKQRYGRIINVTAIPGKAPPANSTPTSVSRAAGIALTKALSKELGPYNILVNTVCIGLIKAGQHETRWKRQCKQDPSLTLDQYYVNTVQARGVPLGRIGEGAEAGDVICFLASDRASYLTGVALNIDGGASPVA